ncbi:flagellin [Geodermatophilus telluris]|uniref:Flagellin n=1 Tax=Geodermatophilus telluris TaxID=1190417 RepID=A0A1G6M9R0_9ACTN|nr:flagellin [Geodermatophilus telluris]SDC51675.1 flagellin [Geodermatophilus telluris]
MGLRVNTNIAALNSYRNLSATDTQMGKSLEKLSSGLRINRAADDAAGLAISEGLRSQIGGLKVAVRNTQDGISVVQTAEGALTETHSILQRMRDLAVQASSDGGLNDDAKKAIQSEIGQLKSELNRIADTTQFNGNKLLDGTYTGKTFQVGANQGETISVGVATAMTTTGLGVSGVSVTAGTAKTAVTVQPVTAGAAGTVTISSAQLDTLDDLKQLNGTITVGNKSLDLATVKLTGATVDDQRADLVTKINAVFGSSATAAGGTGAVDLVITGATGASGETARAAADRAVVFAQSTGADTAITAIENAIKTVSTVRADLGAVQNRFEHTINNLNVAVENLSASESRIRDTDMAQEMVSFTRSQILSQAGTAMLAQANSSSQGVLQLLRG